MPRRNSTLVVLVVLAALALVACGDDSDEGTAGPADTAAACDKAGRTVTVDIGAFLFEPTPVAISRCDEVVWTNSHDQAHTATGDGDQKWSTGNIAPGKSSTEPVPFPRAGSFTYICALHPFMKGTVTVAA